MKHVVLIVAVILLLGCISMTYAQSQQVRVAVEGTAQGQYQANVYYRSSDGRKTTGLGIRVHYQDSIIRVTSTSDVLANSTGLQDQVDQTNYDQDIGTNRFLNAAWFDLNGNWPSISDAEVRLFSINFELRNPQNSEQVLFNLSSVSTASGYELSATNYRSNLVSEPQQQDGSHEALRQQTTAAVRAGIANFSSSIDLESDTQVRELLSQNSAAFRFALDASQKLSSDWSPDAVALEAAMKERGLPVQLAPLLAQLLGDVVAIDAVSLGEGSAAEVLLDALGSAADLRQDALTATLDITLPGERYQGMVSAVRVVSDLLPTGLRFLRNGQAVLVHQGYAFEIAPVVTDLPGFVALVENAGFEMTLRDDGAIDLNLGGGEHFVGVVAYDNLIGSTGVCGDMEIAAPAGPINSPSYTFTVRCANGAQQRIVPFIHNNAFYHAMADIGNAVTTDRNTGVISIEGMGMYKPSYFVSPLTLSESDYLSANKDSKGVAIRYVDVNGDGEEDVVLLTAVGAQLIYRVLP